MANELNCTQFSVPYPDPGINGSVNLTVPLFITRIATAYRPYHYYLLSFIVIFSFLSNVCIVMVLSKKEMRTSGVNTTMLLIAVCDFGCSVSGLTQLFLRIYSSEEHISYLIGYTQITVDYLAMAFHASSLYLAVVMAFCRVMALRSSSQNRSQWQSPKYSLRMALIIFLLIFLSATFALLVNAVEESEEDGIFLVISEFSLTNNCLFLRISLVASGLGFKIAPCVLMIILSVSLLDEMNKGKISSHNTTNNSRNDKEDKLDRSSRFIQVVLVVFLLTESPQGLFNIVGGLDVIDYINYYQLLVSFTTVLSFINTTSSFVIYSTLSSKFRKLFVQTFFPPFISKKFVLVVRPEESTTVT